MTRKPPFLLAYRMGGSLFTETIYADDWPDAERRLLAIKHTGWIDGSDVLIVPVNSVTLPFAAVWVRIVKWWKNA